MNRSFLAVHKIILATIASISFASIVVTEPTLADPNQPFGSLESDRNSNSLSGNGSDFDMMNIIHQAQIGTIKWNAEEGNKQLDPAIDAFKAAQDKLLQPQNQQNPGASQNISGQNQNLLPSSEK